jgi:hypothetical protein
MLDHATSTILIVDDAEHDRGTYRRYLACDRYEILEVDCAEDALALCAQYPIDAILLDYSLPDMTGIEFLEELKFSEGELYPPVIMITGQGNETIAVQALKTGAEDYLVKQQITPDKLRHAIRIAIENAKLRCQLRNTQRQLKESQYFIQQVADTVPGIIYIYDVIEQRNIYVNDQISELLGYTPAQIQAMGENLLPRLFHPEDAVLIPAQLEKLQNAQNGDVFELEYRLQHSNGDWRWFFERNVVFKRTPEDLLQQVLGIAQDITQRKQAELLLQQANERFEYAASAVNCLIYDFDFRTGHVERTRGLYEVVGYHPEEVEPTAEWWREQIHPEDWARFDQEDFNHRMQTEDRILVQYRVRHKQGHYVWVEDQGFVVRDRAGTPIRFVGSTTDITKQKRAEQERETLLQEAQVAREAAIAANRSKDDFLAMVSHELRSPLNAILGWAKLLRSGNLKPEVVEQALTTIERNALAQSQLIEDLLDVSRMIRGTLRITLEPVDLATIVETTVTNLRPSADAKQIEFHSQIHSTALIVGDANRLQQVLTNLLTNAIKFTPDYGLIHVDLFVIDSVAEVIVRDTSKGISPEFLPRIFDRFQQAENATAHAKDGLGLGLAIVRHIVELHGGTVNAESLGIGQGATFTVRLPLSEDQLN